MLAMRQAVLRWLMKRPMGANHLQHVSMRQLSVFLAAAFFLFSVIGFYTDLMNGGDMPYASVLVIAIYSGLYAVAWVVVVARVPSYGMLLLIGLSIWVMPELRRQLSHWIDVRFQLSPVEPATGQRFAATAILIAIICSYVLFAR